MGERSQGCLGLRTSVPSLRQAGHEIDHGFQAPYDERQRVIERLHPHACPPVLPALGSGRDSASKRDMTPPSFVSSSFSTTRNVARAAPTKAPPKRGCSDALSGSEGAPAELPICQRLGCSSAHACVVLPVSRAQRRVILARIRLAHVDTPDRAGQHHHHSTAA